MDRAKWDVQMGILVAVLRSTTWQPPSRNFSQSNAALALLGGDGDERVQADERDAARETKVVHR
jgi:hypothetical protein